MMLAVSNLFDNAIRHAQNNGQIFTSIRRIASVVSIEVRDDGCGISTAKAAALREASLAGPLPLLTGADWVSLL
jgi:signal transduction histidine kinase